MRRLIASLMLVASPTFTVAAPIPVRTPMGSFPIAPTKRVTHVEMSGVNFLPGQEMPEHMHPVPVVCFVTKGSFLVSIGSSPVRQVGVGETTFEPAGTIVHYFRNASATEAAQLNCAFLAGPDDKALSVMLNKSRK
jgi:quercetin dioxygenase-like cupin family protein